MATLHNSSAAYDFSLFEEYAPEVQKTSQKTSIDHPINNVVEMPQQKKKIGLRVRKRALKVVGMGIGLATMVSMVGVLIFGQVQLTELTDQIGKQKTALSEQQSLQTQLQVKADSQLSLSSLEERAKGMGMQKVDTAQATTINLSQGDKSQVVTSTKTPSFLERVWDQIVSLLS